MSHAARSSLLRDEGFSCETCGFRIWIPVAPLTVSTLGFYDDARFPGRCILALHDHFEQFDGLPSSLAASFTSDLQVAGRAVRQATQALRVNYAVLSNVERHLHAHLIPRVRSGDPIPQRPPWEHPQPRTDLPSGQAERIIARIRESLVLP